MLYLTCTTITSVDLAHYGVSRVKDWVSGDCGTSSNKAGDPIAQWVKSWPADLAVSSSIPGNGYLFNRK